MKNSLKKLVRSNRQLALIACCGFVLISVLAIGFYVIVDDGTLEDLGLSLSLTDGDAEEDDNASADAEIDNLVVSPEQKLKAELSKAKTDEDKLAALEDYSKSPEADWDSATLRRLILTGTSKPVRKKAFDISRELAEKEGHDAVVGIHALGLRSVYDNVKQAAIIACRENPKYELLNELTEVVDNDSKNSHLAVQALAFMDAPEAQRKVLEVAKSEDISEAERVQAILLLSETDLSEAVGYLQELTIAEDGQFRDYALEALDIIQDRRANR